MALHNMDVAINTNETSSFELITPEEFISRLKIKKSTLHLWKSKGWLVPRRHFLKNGATVRYFWSKDILLEIHDIANGDRTQGRSPDDVSSRPSPLVAGERINWEY
jgi:hypothetical protein